MKKEIFRTGGWIVRSRRRAGACRQISRKHFRKILSKILHKEAACFLGQQTLQHGALFLQMIEYMGQMQLQTGA